MPVYSQQKDMAMKTNKTNIHGAFMSHVCTSIEVRIIHDLVSFMQTTKYEIAVLMFDGFMYYGQPDASLLDSLSNRVKEVFNFDVNFSFKPHDNGNLKVPEDFLPTDNELIYNTLKHKYETENQLAFIVNPCFFTFRNGDKL